jgi:pre-rRNA-processing protein TSR3
VAVPHTESRVTHDDSPVAPLTVVVVHPRERRSKCTILPLRGHPALRIVRSTAVIATGDLTGYVRLDPTGDPLSEADAASGLLLLDGTWRWVEALAAPFADLPARSVGAVHTAYPRATGIGSEPEGGLATVEALYAAHRLLGRTTEGLLAHYVWAEEFLRRNGWPSPADR